MIHKFTLVTSNNYSTLLKNFVQRKNC